MNGFLKNGLLVVGGVVLGSMMTQKAIIDTLHSKDISIRRISASVRMFCSRPEETLKRYLRP